MEIFSTIDGIVTSKPPPIGEVVSPQSGPIVEIVDFSSLVIEADVPETRMQLLKLRAPCEVNLDAFPNQRYQGEVVDISRRVNRAKATVTVKIKLAEAVDGLLPDMAARINVLSKALDAVALKAPPKIVIPAASLATRDGAKVVFTYEDGKVHMTPIEVGEAFGSGLVLRRGPAVGTRVVTDPPSNMADGDPAKERSDG